MKPAGWLVLGGIGALIAWAVKSAPSAAKPVQTAAVTLDQGLDPTTAVMVQNALQNGTDPNALNSLAAQIASVAPNSAAALKAKALVLRPIA